MASPIAGAVKTGCKQSLEPRRVYAVLARNAVETEVLPSPKAATVAGNFEFEAPEAKNLEPW